MADPAPSARVDPIRDSHYRPLERVESISTLIFYCGALVSFITVVVDKVAHPTLYLISVTLFVVAAVAVFCLGLTARLYLFPRAEDSRRRDFVSDTFGFDLTHERTKGYYNNPETEPSRRLGVSVLENAFFTKSLLRAMAGPVRGMVGVYAVIWLVLALWRDTPLDLVSVAAQVLFSEEIVARWIRLEWARARAEKVYDSTYTLFQSQPSASRLQAYAILAFGEYETGKAIGSVLVSPALFARENARLTKEWDAIKVTLYRDTGSAPGADPPVHAESQSVKPG